NSASCAMEFSRHDLVQGCGDGIVFDLAVFLQLVRDHLDYHHSMEEYFLAKARLFSAGHARAAVINIDDEYGRRLSAMTSLPVTTFSDRKSTRLNSSHVSISYAVFCLKKKIESLELKQADLIGAIAC